MNSGEEEYFENTLYYSLITFFYSRIIPMMDSIRELFKLDKKLQKQTREDFHASMWSGEYEEDPPVGGQVILLQMSTTVRVSDLLF